MTAQGYGWQTPTIETAERRFQRGMMRLALMQERIDGYDAARIVPPADVLSEYDSLIARLTEFADHWGFDSTDVVMATAH